MQTRAHRRIPELDRSRNRTHFDFKWVNLCASGSFQRERNNFDPVGTPTGLDQLQRRLDGKLGRIVCCVHNTSFQRPSTTREMFLPEVHSANVLPSQFEQVLQHGQVPDGVWTDLLDRDNPPAEKMKRPERHALNEEGPGEKNSEKATTIQIEEDPLCSSHRFRRRRVHDSEEKDYESWRQLRRQQRVRRQRKHSHLAKQVVDQEITTRTSIPVIDDVFHASMNRRECHRHV